MNDMGSAGESSSFGQWSVLLCTDYTFGIFKLFFNKSYIQSICEIQTWSIIGHEIYVVLLSSLTCTENSYYDRSFIDVRTKFDLIDDLIFGV